MIDEMREYGEIQGVLVAVTEYKLFDYRVNYRLSQILVIKELSTNAVVDCFLSYRNSDYTQQEILAFMAVKRVLFVGGWLELDHKTGHVNRIEVETVRPAPEFSLDAYKRGLGSMPDYEVEQIDRDLV